MSEIKNGGTGNDDVRQEIDDSDLDVQSIVFGDEQWTGVALSKTNSLSSVMIAFCSPSRPEDFVDGKVCPRAAAVIIDDKNILTSMWISREKAKALCRLLYLKVVSRPPKKMRHKRRKKMLKQGGEI